MSDHRPKRARKEPDWYRPAAPKPKGLPKRKQPIKDKNAPKRPRTAFILYSSDHRASVVRANPNMTFGEIAQEIGNMWVHESKTVQNAYQKKADQDKARYSKEMAAYEKKRKD